MFGIFKRTNTKSKIVDMLLTADGHKAVIQKEKTPHLLLKVRYNVSIYSKTEPNSIIYGFNWPTLDGAKQLAEKWTIATPDLSQSTGHLYS